MEGKASATKRVLEKLMELRKSMAHGRPRASVIQTVLANPRAPENPRVPEKWRAYGRQKAFGIETALETPMASARSMELGRQRASARSMERQRASVIRWFL